MIYDGFDLSSLLVVETPIERSILPPVDVRSETFGGRMGSVWRSSSLGPLELGVKVRIIARPGGAREARLNFEELRRRVAYRLCKPTPRRLVVDDAPDVWYLASLTGDTDLERIAHTGGATLTFLSPDPRAHGRELTLSSPSGGALSARVGGNAATAPVVTIDMEGSSTVVYFDGEPLRLNGTVPGDGEVTVDAVEHRVTKAGEPVGVNINDDYPEWEPAMIHTVECDEPFTLTWEERWL